MFVFLKILLEFFKDFVYLFLERGEGKEKERERNINMWLHLMHPPTEDLDHNPGMCPDWELNQWPSSSQAGAQSTEPRQPGPCWNFDRNCVIVAYQFGNKLSLVYWDFLPITTVYLSIYL